MFHRLSSKIVCLLCVCLFVGPKIMKFGTLVPFVNILVISGVKAPLLFSLYISFFDSFSLFLFLSFQYRVLV